MEGYDAQDKFRGGLYQDQMGIDRPHDQNFSAYNAGEHADDDAGGLRYEEDPDGLPQDLVVDQYTGYDPDAPPPLLPKQKEENVKQKQRLYGGYGDIIAWNDTPDAQPKPESVRVHRDFVSNPSIISHQEPDSPQTKPRRFQQKPRPVPFGTDADIGIAAAPIQPSSGQMRRGYRGDRW